MLRNAIKRLSIEASNESNKMLISGSLIDDFEKICKNMFDVKEKPNNYNISFESMESSNIILVSGGLDSTICYYLFKKSGTIPLFINIGQPYIKKEIKSLELTEIPFEIEKEKLSKFKWKHIIPARNLMLITIASEYCLSGGNIWISSVSGETPETGGDKSLLFFKHAENLIKKYYRKNITIKTMKEKTKSEWIKYFLHKDININRDKKISILESTMSCFSPKYGHCGCCKACLRKYIAFKNCNLDTSFFRVDPLKGCSKIIEEYRVKMSKAYMNKDFSYYTKDRIIETSYVIEELNKIIKDK